MKRCRQIWLKAAQVTRLRLGAARGARGGFVLAELIVAIALIAVVSGIILQMFLAASSVNDNSRTLDSASSFSTRALEEIKLSGLSFEGDFFQNAAFTSENAGYKIVFWLDEDWHSIPAGSKDASALLTAVISPAKERVGIPDTHGSNSGRNLTGTLYSIDITVTLIESEADTKDLLALHSAKYIPHGKEAA